MPKKNKMGALLNRALEPPNFGPKCWAARLKGNAAEFMAEVERQSATGKYVNMAVVSRILEDEYDVSVSDTTVRKHMRRNCKCSRFQRR